MLLQGDYSFFFSASGGVDDVPLGAELLAPPDVEPDVPPALELLPEPLGEALEPLGEALEPLGEALEPLGEALELLLGEELLPPPEAEPDFELSAALEELEELPGVAVEPVGAGALELPPDGDVAEPDAEPEAEPVAPEGDDGEVLGEDVELELDAPGLDALFEPAPSPPSPHAARPKAKAIAPAIRESFMCPPWLGCKCPCKLRARHNPLTNKEQCRACGNLCAGDGSSYLPLPGVAPGLVDFFCAPLVPEDPLEPEVPPAPDGLELPVAELPPLEEPPPC